MFCRLSVKGGVGKIVEYTGEGVKTLSVTDRATITNMGAELGATTSVFPSDENTKAFMESQGRGDDFVPLAPDTDAVYDEVLEVNLSELEPLAAKPHSPDNVDSVKNIGPVKIDQVAIGSCTNSSYTDLMKVAAILKGRKVSENVSLVISPGSSKILAKLASNGALADMISAGARIIENACGPCIGMGQSPKSSGVSLRTFNRNFKGRSGTKDADIYLVSPETAAISAIEGVLTTGMNSELAEIPPVNFDFNDNFIVYPKDSNREENTPVAMGPNIKPFPLNVALGGALKAEVVLCAGDNITTDDISCRRIPGFSLIVPMCLIFRIIVSKISTRSSLPAGKPAGNGAVVGGENYGQGSSREHAALVPLYLGVRFVMAKSFARIHRSNLINSGIIPLVFADPADYSTLKLGDKLIIEDAAAQVEREEYFVRNETTGKEYRMLPNLSELEKE